MNDTVGTMAGGRYFDPDVMIGIILGTGTNACYFERADNVHKLQNGKPLPKTGSMVSPNFDVPKSRRITWKTYHKLAASWKFFQP